MDDTAPQLVDRLEALESEVRQLRRVQECTAALISSLDLSETLDTILRTALDVAGAPADKTALRSLRRGKPRGRSAPRPGPPRAIFPPERPGKPQTPPILLHRRIFSGGM